MTPEPLTPHDIDDLLARHDRVVVLDVEAPSLVYAAHERGLDVENVSALADQDSTTTRLVELVGDGRATLLVAPSVDDDRPERGLAGRAASTAAVRTGATLVEPTEAGAWWCRPPSDTALERLHRSQADPWGVDTRWYERRKRALTLAVLPRARYARALELGCSVGVLTADLAARCDAVVGVDASLAAVDAARERLAALPHVAVQRTEVPQEWPHGRFDLVVVSEMAYFLSPAGLDHLAHRVRECLTDDGVVVACHWRHEVEGWVLDGPEAHAHLLTGLGLTEICRYEDRDITLSLLAHGEALPGPET